jgi:hypothetical protein
MNNYHSNLEKKSLKSKIEEYGTLKNILKAKVPERDSNLLSIKAKYLSILGTEK